MSTSTARALPRVQPRPSTRPVARPAATPRLRVVAPAPGRSRTGLAVLSVTLLVTGLLVLLMLNISIGKGAYTLTELRATQRDAAEQQQALAEQVEDRSAPQQLAKRARAMGMVPAPNTAFVRLSDGTVVGTAAVATAPPRKQPKPAPTKTADAKKPTGTTKQDGAATKTKKPAATTTKRQTADRTTTKRTTDR